MTIIVSDNFNRANTSSSVTGLGVANTGQTWQSFHGSRARIINNTAEISGSYDDAGMVINSGLSDYIMHVRFLTSGGHTQIILRANLVNNSYLFIEANTSDEWYIYYFNGSDWSTVASYYGTASERAGGIVKVVIEGNRVDVFLENKNILSASTTLLQGSTFQGIGTGQNNQVFDDYTIETITSEYEPEEHLGSVSFKGKGKLAVSSKRIRTAPAKLKGEGFLQVSAKKIILFNVNLKGSAFLEASSRTGISGSAELISKGLLGVEGLRESLGAVTFTGLSSLSVESQREATSSVFATGKGLLIVHTGDVSIITAEAFLGGSGTGKVSALRSTSSSSILLGVGELDTKGIRMKNSFSTLSGSGLFELGDILRISTAMAQLIGRGKLGIIEGEALVGVISLLGRQDLIISLAATQEMFEDILGGYELIIPLRGLIGVTKRDQNFAMQSGDSKVLRVTIEDIPNLTGVSAIWELRRMEYSKLVLLEKSSEEGSITNTGEELLINLDPEDSRALRGHYFHFCRIRDVAGNESTVLTGTAHFM